jgi:integrase
VHAVSKEISFFEEDDIKKMIEEAGIRYHTGRLKYRYGYIICANMYLGLRIGELLALKWKDIDLDNGTFLLGKLNKLKTTYSF